MSRPRFGEGLCGEIVGAVRAGASVVEACEQAGVAVNTVKTWQRRGRRESGTEYARFASRIDAARAAAAKREMSPRELRVLVWVAARRGSVSAMRLAWRLLEADRVAAEAEAAAAIADPMSAVDELAARRARSPVNGEVG